MNFQRREQALPFCTETPAFRPDALLKREMDTNHSGALKYFRAAGRREVGGGGGGESEKNDEAY